MKLRPLSSRDDTRANLTRFTWNWTTGAITASHWESTPDISESLIDKENPAVMRRDNDHIYITVANGWALYQIVDTDADRGILKCVLIDSRLDPVSECLLGR